LTSAPPQKGRVPTLSHSPVPLHSLATHPLPRSDHVSTSIAIESSSQRLQLRRLTTGCRRTSDGLWTDVTHKVSFRFVCHAHKRISESLYRACRLCKRVQLGPYTNEPINQSKRIYVIAPAVLNQRPMNNCSSAAAAFCQSMRFL